MNSLSRISVSEGTYRPSNIKLDISNAIDSWNTSEWCSKRDIALPSYGSHIFLTSTRALPALNSSNSIEKTKSNKSLSQNGSNSHTVDMKKQSLSDTLITCKEPSLDCINSLTLKEKTVHSTPTMSRKWSSLSSADFHYISNIQLDQVISESNFTFLVPVHQYGRIRSYTKCSLGNSSISSNLSKMDTRQMQMLMV